MPDSNYQYLYEAHATEGEAYLFLSPYIADPGDLIEHDGELFTIVRRCLYYPEDEICAILSDFVQIHLADSIYAMKWQRAENA